MEQGAAYEVLLPFRGAIQQNNTVPGRYTREVEKKLKEVDRRQKNQQEIRFMNIMAAISL
ncbi:MAG: hypothetical protein D4R88_05805 [Methanosarcinales archaeon]|nr:MAG: hypothetical protein D4R88_05805 [Methanosarcinales archaeon]